MIRWWLSIALSLTALSPSSASAQFVTPLPRPLQGTEVKRDVVYRGFRNSIPDLAPAILRQADSAVVDALKRVRRQRCVEVYGPEEGPETSPAARAIDACMASVPDTELEEIANSLLRVDLAQSGETLPEDAAVEQAAQLTGAERDALKDVIPKVLNYPGFLPIRRADLIPYFKATDFESLSILRQFSAQVKEDHAFVLTETISGSISFLLFGVTYAAVAIKGDPKRINLAGDSVVVDVSADTVRDITASVSRLVNNGGTISGRFQYPIFAGGGTNVQHAASIYSQIGAIGPVGETDSLKLSGALVLEYVAGLTVRKFDASDDVSAELILGARFGWAGSESRLAPQLAGAPNRLDEKSTFFLQLGVGVAEIGGAGFAFSALVTPPWVFEDELEDFIPRAVINLSMLR